MMISVSLLLVGCQQIPAPVTEAAFSNPTALAATATPFFRPIKPKITPSATALPTYPPHPSATPFDINGLLPTPDPLGLPAQSPVIVSAGDVAQIIREQFQPPPDLPDQVNELAYDEFIVMDRAVVQRMRQIYERGQALGRDRRAFTRTGDSTIEPPHFFERFDSSAYNLGDFSYLQRTIDFYSGSFARRSLAVRRGLHTWSVLDPMWAGPPCLGGEHMLACEFRLHNPSLIFIRLGSNDRGLPDETERNLRNIVDFSLEQGVIPIMATKADRFDGIADLTNTAIRQIAADYRLPLWDFDRLASTLPNRGLGSDAVHLTVFYAHDWTLDRAFSTGHGLHNLSGLIMLDHIWQVLHD